MVALAGAQATGRSAGTDKLTAKRASSLRVQMSAYSMQGVAGAGSSSVKVSFAELRPNVDMPLRTPRSGSLSPNRSGRVASRSPDRTKGGSGLLTTTLDSPRVEKQEEQPMPPFRPDVDPTGDISKVLHDIHSTAAQGRRRLKQKIHDMKAKLARDNVMSRPALLASD